MLSTTSGQPCSCAISASAGTSASWRCGFESDSTKTALVVGLSAARTASSVTDVDPRHLDPLARQHVVEQEARDDEHVIRGDAVIARGEQAEDGAGDGGHP